MAGITCMYEWSEWEDGEMASVQCTMCTLCVSLCKHSANKRPGMFNVQHMPVVVTFHSSLVTQGGEIKLLSCSLASTWVKETKVPFLAKYTSGFYFHCISGHMMDGFMLVT